MSDTHNKDRDDLVALARQLFGDAGCAEALALVDQYGTEPHEREVDRVRRSILELSDGKKTRLPYFVQCAKIDYRDVLERQRLGPMNDKEEARWQIGADRLLALWNAKK